MIEPPSFNTDERYEYDILDLELLGHMAVKLNVHGHPKIKRLFTDLFHKAGGRGFSEDCCMLYQLLFSHQAQLVAHRTDHSGYHTHYNFHISHDAFPWGEEYLDC